MGQVECMTHETDCISHRCLANEHVSQGICMPCPDGLSRAAGDDPLAGDTTCEDNFIDLCPNDANKIEPGLCGCGRPDRVENGDGTANCGTGRCARDQFVEDGRCFDCPEGTYRDEPAVIARGGSACTDIDECESDPCDANATCTNRFGGFSCRCEPDFEGDGLSCKPRVDEVSGSHEAPPRLNDLPFADLLPSFPQYRIPTLDDCHWTIDNGVAQSRHGLDDIDDEYLVGAAYRASIEAGHVLPIRFCVYDNAGQAVFGGGYSQYGNRSIFVRDGEGYLPLEAEFVGLTDTAEMQIGWDVKWGKLEHLGLYNIGLRGPNDSFIIRANSGIGTLIIDGCWWLASRSYAPGGEHAGSRHASGMHIDKWDTLVWRRHRWRGERPDEPGINLREHSGYLKSSRGQTWILENDLRGGNRTGFQIRPQRDSNERPVGPVVVAYNRAQGYGWNNGHTPETYDGGSALTIWTNPDDMTFVFRNEITDAKYGCLMVGAQPPEKNWLNERGFAIGEVFIAENRLENLQGDRGAFEVTGVERLHMYANEVQDQITFDGRWGINRHGIRTGEIRLYEAGLVERPIHTYDEGAARTRLLSRAEKMGMYVE